MFLWRTNTNVNLRFNYWLWYLLLTQHFNSGRHQSLDFSSSTLHKINVFSLCLIFALSALGLQDNKQDLINSCNFRRNRNYCILLYACIECVLQLDKSYNMNRKILFIWELNLNKFLFKWSEYGLQSCVTLCYFECLGKNYPALFKS